MMDRCLNVRFAKARYCFLSFIQFLHLVYLAHDEQGVFVNKQRTARSPDWLVLLLQAFRTKPRGVSIKVRTTFDLTFTLKKVLCQIILQVVRKISASCYNVTINWSYRCCLLADLFKIVKAKKKVLYANN